MSEAASDVRRRSGLIGFFGLSAANQWALAESLATLALVSLAIRVLPFRTVVKAARSGKASPATSAAQNAAIFRCRWAVEKWAGIVPWRTVCFQKGLALHMMLRRRGIGSILHYGVMQNEARGLTAHVWVSEGDRILMGGETAGDYRRLASFPALDEAAPGTGG